MEFTNMTESEYADVILKRINLIMVNKGFKQLDLAEKSYIGQSTLSKLMKGEMRITLNHIIKICKALDIEPCDLFSLNKNIDFNYNNSSDITDDGLIDNKFIDNQILIRDTRHPAFKGYKNNCFKFYCFSTISSEANLLEGELNFSETINFSYCNATLLLYTGQIDKSGNKITKKYTGELIISLTMGSCYCILVNSEIGEICLINFKHTFLFNQELECRVGALVSTSSGGNKLPIMQRVLISRQKLNVNDVNDPDYTFIRGQLNLNDSSIYILEDLFKDLLEDRENKYNLKSLSEFFEDCDDYMVSRTYRVIDESKIRDSAVSSDLKTEGIGVLRRYSTALKYNKISTKTEEFVFQYINNKLANKDNKAIKKSD